MIVDPSTMYTHVYEVYGEVQAELNHLHAPYVDFTQLDGYCAQQCCF